MADQVVLLNARPHRAGRDAGRALRAAGHHLRRALHRHAADEPAAARRRRGGAVDRRHRRPGGRCRRVRRRARSACAPSTSRSRRARRAAPRCSGGRVPRRRFARHLPASAARPSPCASPAASRSRPGDAGLARVGAGRAALCSTATAARVAADRIIRPQRSSRSVAASSCQRRKTMLVQAVAARAARAGRRARRGARARAGAGRDLLLLPGRRRRADHQDHRRLRRRLREGEPRHQGEADLRRHLPGDDRQGAHRASRAATPPVTSVLLSTDMFTLIDEDAIVPVRRPRQDAPTTRRG